jgi:hypothetical protein
MHAPDELVDSSTQVSVKSGGRLHPVLAPVAITTFAPVFLSPQGRDSASINHLISLIEPL